MNNSFFVKGSLIFILFLLLTFISYSKEEFYTCTGTITCMDLSLCMCCGGWFIDIDNTTYRFYKLPDHTNLNLENESFPVKVKLDWEKEPNPCLGDEIIINRITKN